MARKQVDTNEKSFLTSKNSPSIFFLLRSNILSKRYADLSVNDRHAVGYIERFDVVLNRFNSFGYFSLEEEDNVNKMIVPA
jgi:hypothetical protein